MTSESAGQSTEREESYIGAEPATVESRLTRGENPMKAMLIMLLATVLSAQSPPRHNSSQLPLASDMKTLGLVGGTHGTQLWITTATSTRQ